MTLICCPEARMRRGRLQKNWTETVNNDLRGMEILWGGQRSWRWTELSGEVALPNVQTCTDGLRSKVRYMLSAQFMVSHQFCNQESLVNNIFTIALPQALEDDCVRSLIRRGYAANLGTSY